MYIKDYIESHHIDFPKIITDDRFHDWYQQQQTTKDFSQVFGASQQDDLVMHNSFIPKNKKKNLYIRRIINQSDECIYHVKLRHV